MNNDSSFDVPGRSARETIKQVLQPTVILRSVLASAVIWLIMISLLPSFSGLIFRDRLAGYFAAGLSIMLVSQLVIVLITSLFSSDHSTVAVPQSPPVVVQGIIAGGVIAAAPADMSPDTLFAVVFWIIALSAFLTGGFLLLLGIGRAGDLIRYIPYPIVGGFMAGLGWLMLNAGFIVVVGLNVNAETLPVLMDGGVFARWLPALIVGLGILGLQARVKSTMIVPGTIIVSLALFYACVYLIVGDVNAVEEAGWFLPKVSGTLGWHLPDLAAIAQIDPSMIAASAGNIVTMIVVVTLNLFFKASAQELIINRELNFNRECMVNGIANISVSLFGGGAVGYHTPSFTALVETFGVYGRLVGIILAFMCALTILFGSTIFALFPRFLPAGILMYFGLVFMKEWLLDSWAKLPRRDYVTVVVIALATALLGFLPGIALGLVVTISFFVLEYSRMDVIKQEFSARFHRSNLDRSFSQNQLLQEEGDKILILRLQGFVFFGTAYRFYEHVKARISESASEPPKFLILDFKAVRGIDASAIHDLMKLKRLTGKNGIDLLISSVLPQLQPVLADGGIVERRSGRSSLFNDLDHALEWCENAMLADADLLAAARVTVEEQLAQHTEIQSQDVSALHTYLERMETKVGDTVFSQGDRPDAMYFIESGRVDVLLRVQSDQVLRLRSMTAGTVVGEVGFYLKKARIASVVVTEAGVLQRLSLEALRQMQETAPYAASAIHVLISCVLSDRLSSSNRVIQELMD